MCSFPTWNEVIFFNVHIKKYSRKSEEFIKFENLYISTMKLRYFRTFKHAKVQLGTLYIVKQNYYLKNLLNVDYRGQINQDTIVFQSKLEKDCNSFRLKALGFWSFFFSFFFILNTLSCSDFLFKMPFLLHHPAGFVRRDLKYISYWYRCLNIFIIINSYFN